jgi:hypothetical protein
MGERPVRLSDGLSLRECVEENQSDKPCDDP